MIIPNRFMQGEHCLYDEWYIYTENRNIFCYKKKTDKQYRLAERIKSHNSVSLRVIGLFNDLTSARDFADKHYYK